MKFLINKTRFQWRSMSHQNSAPKQCQRQPQATRKIAGTLLMILQKKFCKSANNCQSYDENRGKNMLYGIPAIADTAQYRIGT